MWAHKPWQHCYFPASGSLLKHYSQVFNTAEGNTTFYGIPSEAVVETWVKETHADFSHCFKLPRAITHDKQLLNSDKDLELFLTRVAPLSHCMGVYCIQLSASFSPVMLPTLDRFLSICPKRFDGHKLSFAVEVRHLDFFAKGQAEKDLMSILRHHDAERILLDSRALFSTSPMNHAMVDAQKKKPRVPLHVIAIGGQPLVRFIGHPNLPHNDPYLDQWVKKFVTWIGEGKRPYFFVHTPNNDAAPTLALRFHNKLKEFIDVGELELLPREQGDQGALF